MPQFTVYRNMNPKSRADIPFLLDVQANLLAVLGSRVVIPLYRKEACDLLPFSRLAPEFTIEDESCILMTPQLAGVPLKQLGEPVADLSVNRDQIIAALDLLISGF